jgi:WD40 repeat protein
MAQLDAAAGRPTLKQIVGEAQRRGHPTLSISKLSNWRRGANIPRRFAELRPVLGLLIARASTPDAARPPHLDPAIYDIYAWERLHRAALATRPESRQARTPTVSPVAGEAEAPCPYLGLAAFQEGDHAVFFGRESATATMIARLNEASASGGITALVGDSGAGKSSLLRAGLIWAVRNGQLGADGVATGPIVIMTPGEDPLGELTNHIATLREPLDALRQAQAGDDAVTDGAGDTDRAALDAIAERIREAVAAFAADAGDPTSRPLVIVDQAEELFTLCDDGDSQAAFIATLHALCTPARAGEAPTALVLLALRADFYNQFLGYRELREALETRQITLGPMSKPELRDAITKPAERAGLSLETNLISLLLHDMGVRVGRGRRGPAYDAGLLPLLSHALVATWVRRDRRDAKLTVEGYNAGGGIRGAVAATGERAWGQLDRVQQTAAVDVLLKLTRIGADTQDTRRRLTKRQLLAQTADPVAAEKALDVLTDARLVTQEAESVQITHEALLQEWPRLRSQIDVDRAGHLVRQRIEDAATDWADTQLPKDKLYRGTILAEARDWASDQAHRSQLSEVAAAFLAASAQEEQKATTTRRRVLIGLGSLTVLALGGMAGSVVAAGEASRERDTAIFGQITAEANRLRTVDVSLAALLDLVAYRRRQTPDVATNLIGTENAALCSPATGHEGAVNCVAWSPDRRTLASSSDDHTMQLWSVDSAGRVTPRAKLLGHRDVVIGVAFSPDGRTLASGGYDQTARLWDVTDPDRPREIGAPMTGYDDNVIMVAWSPDGRTLASGSADESVHVWDVTDRAHPRQLARLPGHHGDVNSVSWSPDGRTLASGSDDQTIRLWDLTDVARPVPLGPPLTGHRGDVVPVLYSPDGRILASGGEDGTVRLWDVSNPAHPAALGLPLIGHRGLVFSVSWSPDGRTLASASVDRTVRMWNVSDPTHATDLGQPLYGHSNIVYSVQFSKDGRKLASGGEDRTMRVWDVPPALIGHTAAIACVALSPDRRTLASGGDDHTLRLWDLTASDRPTLITQLAATAGHLGAAAFSPDGRTLASGGDDNLIRLWAVADPAHPLQVAQLPGHTQAVDSVAFSPDGRTLASGGDDGNTLLWNVADPARPAQVAKVDGNGEAVQSVSWSPDGRRLATACADKTVLLWNVADPARPVMLAQLAGHTRPVNSVAFSPDGRTVASGSADQSIRLWEVTDPAHPTQLAALGGHSANVLSVAFSRDGRTLASGSADQTIRLWDVSDPLHATPIGSGLVAHTDAVNAVVFSTTDNTLASASTDLTVRLWNIDPGTAIQRICATTQGTLTPQTWNQYFLDVAYKPPCQVV